MQPALPDTAASDEANPPSTMSSADRCDACGAQAYVRVELVSGELLFCAHHGNKHKEKLSPLAQSWHDESERILEGQRSSS